MIGDQELVLKLSLRTIQEVKVDYIGIGNNQIDHGNRKCAKFSES